MIKQTLAYTNFISRPEAEEISGAGLSRMGMPTSLISIISPDDDTMPIDHSAGPWSDVLYLQFHDVDPKGCSEEWKAKYVLFDDVQARQIIDFAHQRAYQDSALLVHCEGGISRSAGVAKFIAERYALQFPEAYKLYNKHVYRKLVQLYYGDYEHDE